MLANETVKIFQRAKLDVDMPYFSWQLKVMCMRKPVYDLTIGNIEGSGKADDPDPLWKPEACDATRKPAEAEDCTTPFKVAEKVDMTIIDREKLIEMQASDTSLDRCMNEKSLSRSKENKWNF
ncbi:hypothetical protein RRG08_065679 [Elysia crispata]|uniref:Uncharacterized protein n=1 Tax=Elysia crispata TaxID=231223 RepID=A0AAE1E1Q3_9GAST|nr:hypothetical protein RRG08_065679 [Elysia crispata]